MGYVYVVIIDLIFLFILFVVLNSRIRKSSAQALLTKYAREVEQLIVEMNQSVDDVVTIAEDRIEELKGLIAQTEKLMKRPAVRRALAAAAREETGGPGDVKASKDREAGRPITEHQPAGAGAGDAQAPQTPAENPAAAEQPPGTTSGQTSGGAARQLSVSGSGADRSNLLEKTRRMLAMGHSKEEIAKTLNIGRAEVDFLESLSR